MSHPTNPNTLGTKMMVSTKEKVIDKKMSSGMDLAYTMWGRHGWDVIARPVQKCTED